MNANNLAMRDAGLAALMGAISGGNFGSAAAEPDPFNMSAYAYGQDTAPQASPYGADFGDFGYGGFGVALPPAPPGNPMMPATPHIGPPMQPAPPHWGGHGAPAAPHPHEVARVWHEHHARLRHEELCAHHEMGRVLLLDPNKYSRTKVERYSFTLVEPLQFGEFADINSTLQPAVKMRPDRLVSNAPLPFFVELDTIQVSNVNVLVGGSEDAYTYWSGAQNVVLQLPTIEPAFRVTMTGSYSGVTPSPYQTGTFFNFRLSFQGWSVLAGNG
jgi:hypothetical protein